MLQSDWQFRAAHETEWRDAAVPGSVHTDLLKHDLIPDPFYGTNEKDLQWIDKKNWEYRLEFQCSDTDLEFEQAELIFDGLDTYAEVSLNGTSILSAENMFRQWRVSCRKLLKTGANELHIRFLSHVNVDGPKLQKLGYDLPAVNDQSEQGGLGDQKISVFARKAGYHYGWDWGPRFITMGIWRPVRLEFWNEARLENVYIRQTSVTQKKAVLDISANVKSGNSTPAAYEISFSLDEECLFSGEFTDDDNPSQFRFRVEIPDPELWWSNGLGKPHLYSASISLKSREKELDQYTEQIGLRSIKLVQEPDAKGRGFAFHLNDVPVFAKGANYIPNDNFLSRVSRDKLESILQSAADANMNMLRVWGGGIYEDDLFYHLCDEKGLLVWQDFMFACSLYPGDPDFVQNVKQEVIDNIIRLRNHACLALWCGNNEIDVAWSQFSDGGWGWKDNYAPELREKLWQDYDRLFNYLIPECVSDYDPQTDYWPSSPMAGPRANAHYESTSGDIHYWGVWHADHPFSHFKKYVGRFMSEYGFQSFPDLETVKTYAPEDQWDINSEVMTAHQRSKTGGNERIHRYMEDHYRLPDSFEKFLYLSQLLQAEGVRAGIEAHRRKMPYCMGTLYWQLNDCWPVASWSSLDCTGKWKALHYFARKAFEPLLLSCDVEDGVITVTTVSDLTYSIQGIMELELQDFSGNSIWNDSMEVETPITGCSQMLTRKITDISGNHHPGNCFLIVRLRCDDTVVAENSAFLVPQKELKLRCAALNPKVSRDGDGWIVSLESSTLVKNIMLTFSNINGHFSDNFFDLLPGRPVRIRFTPGDNPDEISRNLKLLCLNNLYD